MMVFQYSYICRNFALGVAMVINATGAEGGQGGVVRYAVTQRGAPCLILDGFGFVARKRRGSRVYWTCRSRKQHGCPARALTVDGRLVMRHSRHNHVPHKQTTQINRIESLIEIISADK